MNGGGDNGYTDKPPDGMPIAEDFLPSPEELEKRKLDVANYRYPGGGESMRDLSNRVLPFLRKIIKDQRGKDILIVAHGAVNRVVLCDALGLEPNNVFRIQQDYGCLNIIDYYSDNTLVRLING